MSTEKKDYTDRASFRNPDGPASSSQTFLIRQMTGLDVRQHNLTTFQAAQIINKLMEHQKAVVAPLTMKLIDDQLNNNSTQAA